MRKIITLVLLVSLLSLQLAGCGASKKVEYISDGTTQMSDDEKSIELYFSLLNKKEERITSDGKVDIRIINSEGQSVYSDTIEFTEDNFDTYSNTLKGDMLLCMISIPLSKVTPGKSSSGTIYFTVYKDDTFYFKEMADKIYAELPIAEATLTLAAGFELPIEVSKEYWNGGVESKVTITDVKYSVDSYSGTSMTIYFIGQKTYDREGENGAA